MINKTYEKRQLYKDNRITCNKLEMSKETKSLISNIDTLITFEEVLNLKNIKRGSTYIPERIKSALEYEDYVANTYGKYGLVKYDFKLYTRDLSKDLLFFDYIERMMNNKRRHNTAKEIIGYTQSIDMNYSHDCLHMHLFIFFDISWLSGEYEKDKYLFKQFLIKLNKWMIKLARTMNNDLKYSYINIPDDDMDMVDCMASMTDVLSRNDKREYLGYNGKMDEYLNERRVGAWFSRSKIPSNYSCL